ncbi:hypothetical protein ACFZCY_38945 [Streptomyces sp. NPDC007983]|uniref:hypothetical protein n=1 Tax=Streptomyces sp. NPDC007983 TaxID=3364800 RepID=UPI0036E039AC
MQRNDATSGGVINAVQGGNQTNIFLTATDHGNPDLEDQLVQAASHLTNAAVWKKRYEAYEAFNATWAQFHSYMRSCERILTRPLSSTEVRAATERHAELIDEWRIQMGRITLVDSDITPAKEALEAATKAMQEMNHILSLRISILEGEHFTGRALQERREKLNSAKNVADERFWEFLSRSSVKLGISRDPSADH